MPLSRALATVARQHSFTRQVDPIKEGTRLDNLTTVSTHFGVSETSVRMVEENASDVRASSAPLP